MIKKNTYPTITETVENELQSISKVKDISASMRKFNKLQYPQPKHYKARDIRRLRKRLLVSQAVFAHLLNARLTTVQKWERGIHEPSGPIDRLLEIIDRYGLNMLKVN